MSFDVLIVGGGPAGATTGLLLARAGWSVAIIEKKTFPRRKVCGEFISATSLPLLQEIGMGDFYLQHAGPPVKRVALFANDTMVSSAMPEAQQGWGRAFGREHLDTFLLNEAMRSGANVWQSWTAVELQRKENDYLCNIKNENEMQTIAAKRIIIASGSWEKSILQNANRTHRDTDFLAFKAHFLQSDLENDLMPLIIFPGGYGGMVHTDNQRVTLSCCIRRDILQTIRKQNPGVQASDVVFQHIVANCKGVREASENALLDGAWLSTGPIQPGIRTCHADGIFYVGNIVGEAHPIIAEGISMAMQSGKILAKLLMTCQESADVAERYTRLWKQQFANRIYAAAIFAQLAVRPNAVNLLLPVIKKFPKVLTFGAKLSGKVKPLFI